MKAFVIPQAGSDVLELADVPIPTIARDELLVRVRAVGVGIHDSYFVPEDARFPYPIGIEAAGVVEQIGGDVVGPQPGDCVALVSPMQSKGGTWAEFVAVNMRSLIIPIPNGMGFVEAAAVPVAGNTILKAFRAFAGIPVGGSLFIAGGSGAIGTLAIQMAGKEGWRVAASASERNHDYLLSLGAEKVVDYHDHDWTAQVLEWMPSGVDAAMAVQPGTTAQTLPVVKDGGTLVTISGDELQSARGVHVQGIPYQADVREQSAQLFRDISAGDIRVELAQVHPFEEALIALAKVQTRHTRGKLVLRMG